MSHLVNGHKRNISENDVAVPLPPCLMATPPSRTPVTPHTSKTSTADDQEDSEPVNELAPADGERRSIGHKFLHSKAIQKMSGGKRHMHVVAATMDIEQSPSRVSVTASKRQSTTTSALQSPQTARNEKPVKEQMQEPYALPSPPQGPLRPLGSPSTSPRVTSTAVITQQPAAHHQVRTDFSVMSV